jgi:voltage-gated sodium channel type IV alpha
VFEVVITIFIVLNTVCLAVEHDGMNEKFRQALNNANHAFTAIFILEMVLKITAFGFRGYVRSRWNIFDGIVVCISIIDVIIEISTTTDNGDLSILRSFRLLRVLKLAQSWSTMRMLLNAMGKSLGALGNLILILLIILYMLAIIGVNLFSESYTPDKFPDGKVPVWNFSNFGHSLMMMIRLLCGEWIEPLYDCMLATGPASIIFFMASLIVGNFLVLNLFLALLLSSFSELQVEEEMTKRKKNKSKLKWINSSRRLLKFKKEKKEKAKKEKTCRRSSRRNCSRSRKN